MTAKLKLRFFKVDIKSDIQKYEYTTSFLVVTTAICCFTKYCPAVISV